MKQINIFVIMPFDIEFNDFYTHIKDLIKSTNVETFRADDLLNQQNILKDIVQSIQKADIVLADLTGANANVYYELGLAHALRKNVILLTQDISDLPFDLKSYRVIEYSTHFSKIKVFNERLLELISEFNAGKISFGNPITDWLLPVQEEKTLVSEPNTPRESDESELIEMKGYIDFMADFEEAAEKLTEIVNEFVSQTKDMGNNLNAKTELVNVAVKSGSASQVRKIAKVTAEILNDYGISITELNRGYQSTWNVFEDSLLNLVNSPFSISSEENINKFKDFLETLENLKPGMNTAMTGISSMAEGVTSLIGIEGSITRAASLIHREVKNFEGQIEKSISTIDRVINVGSKNLKNKVNHVG